MTKAHQLIREAQAKLLLALELPLPHDIKYEVERASVDLGLALESADEAEHVPIRQKLHD